jgi:hypothetical protein
MHRVAVCGFFNVADCFRIFVALWQGQKIAAKAKTKAFQ